MLYDYYQLQAADTEYTARYNIAPTQQVLAIVNDGTKNRAGYLRWGLVPSWADNISVGQKMINARAETITEKPSFRQAYQRRRCLIPVNGFYEWKKSTEGKIPMFISLKSRFLFSFAGLWERWVGQHGENITTCTIITTAANEFMREIHHRMPVILKPEMEKHWLNKGSAQADLQSLLVPYSSSDMTAYAVSNDVNSVKNEGEKLIKRLV